MERGRGGLGWAGRVVALSPVAALLTWTCCALPILLVGLGLGSAVAALAGSAPWLVALSRHKAWIFLAVGALLVWNFVYLYRGRAACDAGDACHASRPLGRWLRRLYWASVVLYGLGLAAAYLALPLVELAGRRTD